MMKLPSALTRVCGIRVCLCVCSGREGGRRLRMSGLVCATVPVRYLLVHRVAAAVCEEPFVLH